MRIRLISLAAALLLTTLPALAQAPNTVTRKEAAAGWYLLWDGKTAAGWRSSKDTSFPATGWQLKDGLLSVTDSSGEEGSSAVDILTTQSFTNFELTVDFRITTGANSGIKYFIDPDANNGRNATIGFEYQILDDAVHPDAKKGRNGNRTQASLYDMIAPIPGKPERPIGAWNTARIIVRGAHGEHWLNGVEVVDYDRFTPQFRQLVADSKYHVYPGFGEAHAGHILLQDHGFPVSFRNIKIRELPPTPAK